MVKTASAVGWRLLKRWWPPVLILAGLLTWYAPLARRVAAPKLVQAAANIVPTTPAPSPDLNSLSYPRLGITAHLRAVPETSPLLVRDWPTMKQALKEGLILSFRESSWADSRFAYLVGHSSDSYPHPYSTIFAGLGQAAVGDQFSLNVNGEIDRFVVDKIFTLKPADTAGWQALEQPDPTGPKRLALVTCWPILTTRLRLVVLSHQIN